VRVPLDPGTGRALRAGLAPIQRRLVDPGSDLSAADVERLRMRWLRGHLIRTLVALVAFVFLVVAAVA
jgi:Domain of unknown function (DUF1772)